MRELRIRELVTSAGGALAVAFLFLCISSVQGALGIPRNDDWAYYRVLFRLSEEGTFSLDGWTQMFFAGQAYLFLPLAKLSPSSIETIQVGVALIGAIGLWSTYLVIRSVLQPGQALLCLGCLALGPIYGSLSTSFMTDVPAFSLQAIALLLGVLAFRRQRSSMLLILASLACAAFAFTIREFGLTPGLVVLTAAWARSRGRSARTTIWLGAITASWLTLLVILFLWRQGLLNSMELRVEVPPADIPASLNTLAALLLTLSLLVVPATLAMAPWRMLKLARQRGSIQLGFALALILVVILWRPPLLPGYLGVQISYDSTVMGVAPPFLPLQVWNFLWCLGVASFGILTLLVLLASRARRQLLRRHAASMWLSTQGGATLIFLSIFITLSLAAGSILFTNSPYFDRYLIGLVPLVAAMGLHMANGLGLITRISMTIGWVALLSIALYSIALSHAVAAIDGAKWRLARTLVSQGYQPSEVAGSMEWWGFHHNGPVLPIEERRNVAPFWLGMFGDRRACAVIHYANPDGYFRDAIREERIETLLGSVITLVAKDVPGCQLEAASKSAGY